MFTATARRLASAAAPSLSPRLRQRAAAAAAGRPKPPGDNNSKYKPKKVWPPDFSKLSEKQQFRFEKRYKRRIALASRRPQWDRWTKMAQFVTITAVVVYSLLFREWEGENNPLKPLRATIFGVFDAFSPSQRDVRREPEIPTEPSGSR